MSKMPAWADMVLIPLISLILAGLLSALVILAIGESPIEAVNLMITGALGSSYGWGYTLYYATNFMFTGLAVSVAFHARLFNIGGEGQAMLGGIGCGLGLSLHPVAALVFGPVGCDNLRCCLWRALGFAACLSSGQTWQPYCHHHDHVQLYRGRFSQLSSGQCPASARQYGSRHRAVFPRLHNCRHCMTFWHPLGSVFQRQRRPISACLLQCWPVSWSGS